MTQLFSFLQALGLATLFLIFINGSVGWAMIYVLVGVGLLSVISCLLSKKRFAVELPEFIGVTDVKQPCDFTVTLRKKGFCILPHIDLVVTAGGESYCIKTALLFKSVVQVPVRVAPTSCGLNRVVAVRAEVSDFWSMVRLSVPLGEVSAIAVMPRLTEYNGPDILPNTLPCDDSDPEEGRTVLSGGLPGYEHRDYVPGDPLRRINYKLSAKRGRIMVRLEESAGVASINIHLCAAMPPTGAEQALALARKLVIQGGSVRISMGEEHCNASTPQTLDKMREWLAFREYSTDPDSPATEPIPDGTDVYFGRNGTAVCNS